MRPAPPWVLALLAVLVAAMGIWNLNRAGTFAHVTGWGQLAAAAYITYAAIAIARLRRER